MLPKVAITFDYYADVFSTAFPMMQNLGIVGTYFVDPDTIGAIGGPDRDNLTVLKMFGWTIGAYTGINMVEAMNNNRNTAMDKLVSIRRKMIDFGFPARSLAPNQRAWDSRLCNVSAGMFERIRVADNFVPQPIPVPDPLWIKNGGTPSLGINDTAVSLNADVDSFLSQPVPGLWSVVAHKVGAVPDAYTVETSVFSAFLNRLATEKSAGRISIVGYDDI